MNRDVYLEWISANVLQTARVFWRVLVLFFFFNPSCYQVEVHWSTWNCSIKNSAPSGPSTRTHSWVQVSQLDAVAQINPHVALTSGSDGNCCIFTLGILAFRQLRLNLALRSHDTYLLCALLCNFSPPWQRDVTQVNHVIFWPRAQKTIFEYGVPRLSGV